MTQGGYQHDVFLSYPRRGSVGRWVQNHFHPLLCESLEEQWDLDWDFGVYFDREGIETGARWADALRDALKSARCLVAVLAPLYFRRPWCQAEWRSMLERERVLASAGYGHRLIFPVIYSRGDVFPPGDAGAIQYHDLTEFGYPEESFAQTQAYMHFRKQVRLLAKTIITRVRQAPAWDERWPLLDPPEEKPAPVIQLAR